MQLSIWLAVTLALSFPLLPRPDIDGTNGTEDLFGPANVNGVTSNGAMAAGISAQGEVTVLRWPKPGYNDHVYYLTPVLQDTSITRELPYMGAAPNAGVFGGILVEGAAQISWLRDAPWRHDQFYRSDASNVLVTTGEDPRIGLSFSIEDFVVPGHDVLVRHYTFSRHEGTSIERLRFIAYENLAPCSYRMPYLVLHDWYLDDANDFALLYRASEDALLHFHPHEAKRVKMRRYVRADQATIDRIDLDALFPPRPNRRMPPVYFAIGADRPSVGHQCGLEREGATPEDAFLDSQDGELSGSSIAVGKASGALAFDLDLSAGDAEVTLFFAAAGSQRGALSELQWARDRGKDALLAATEAWWSDWIAPAVLPDTDDPEILRTAKRTLISIRQGYDNESGAIVASITAQPPYGFDWPRDGAFFNHALDLAGYHDLVTRHNRFYARVQRQGTGTYAMNYFSDGLVGGPIFFEIDNSALAAWTLWDHASFLEDEEERRAYLAEVYPALRNTVEFLARWRDPKTGLPRRAFEDDNPKPSQGLQGAITVHLALESGIAAGEVMGEDPAVLESWRRRLAELREAIMTHLYDPEEGRFLAGRGQVAWLIWPARFLPPDDPIIEREAARIFGEIVPPLRRTATGSSYDGKITLALAKIGWESNDPIYTLRWAIDVLMREVPSPGTRHYGEVYVLLDDDGDGVPEFHNRTALPHLWTAALDYMSALTYYGAKGGKE